MTQGAGALIFALRSLAKKLEGPSLRLLLATISAKVLPTLSYASAAMHGKDSETLNKLISIYKKVL